MAREGMVKEGMGKECKSRERDREGKGKGKEETKVIRNRTEKGGKGLDGTKRDGRERKGKRK